jgi:hypothetical protein
MNHTGSRIATLLFSGLFLLLSIWQVSVGNIPLNSGGLGILTAAGLTLALFSFLYDDNPLFKIAEHLYVGVAAGYGLALVWFQVILADLVNPIYLSSEQGTKLWTLIVPSILGILLVMRIVPKLGWLSRISFAYVVGFGAGISIPAYIASQLLEQVHPTLAPAARWHGADGFILLGALVLIVAAFFVTRRGSSELGLSGWLGPVLLSAIFLVCFFNEEGTASLVLVGVVAVLFYFFFSVEHTGAVGAISRVGIWFLMIAFGASFGFTVMARISLLIGRMQFLLGDWLQLLGS